jgi:ribosome-binding factor A
VSANRPDRVAEAIRVELSQLLAKDVHDPGVGFITLTKVTVTPDLQLARIYYTTLGDEKAQKDTDKALHRASPFLRRQIAQRVRLRRVPEIEFFFDKSVAQHDRVERILQELKAEADARPPVPLDQSDAAAADAPRERSGDLGAPASERAEGSGGAKPPGLNNDTTDAKD